MAVVQGSHFALLRSCTAPSKYICNIVHPVKQPALGSAESVLLDQESPMYSSGIIVCIQFVNLEMCC